MVAKGLALFGIILSITFHTSIWGLSLDDQVDNTNDALDRLTVRLGKLDRRLESLVRARNDVELVGKELTSNLDFKLGDGCERARMYRCGSTHQCISDIKLCDGTEDCANGEDEASCENIFEPGDVFVGGFLYNFCLNGVGTASYADRWEFLGIETNPMFPQRKKVRSEYTYNTGTGYTGYINDEIELLLGRGQLINHFTLGEEPQIEVCRYLHNAKAIECSGHRARLFGIVKPCYLSYHKKVQ